MKQVQQQELPINIGIRDNTHVIFHKHNSTRSRTSHTPHGTCTSRTSDCLCACSYRTGAAQHLSDLRPYPDDTPMEHGAQRRTAPILRQRHPYIFETSHSVSGTESIQHQSIAADQLYTTCMSYMYELVSGVCALMWSEHDTPPAVSTPKRGVS
jgi:hypothetical protein